MITKRILNPKRIRTIESGFGFIPHRFIKDGFLQTLSKEELILYFFLTLVSDRIGISFYSYDSICNLLGLDINEYLSARNGLIEKDLISFDNNIFQVLSLPQKPVQLLLKEKEDPATIRKIIMSSIGEVKND